MLYITVTFMVTSKQAKKKKEKHKGTHAGRYSIQLLIAKGRPMYKVDTAQNTIQNKRNEDNNKEVHPMRI
jgi:hypothetical protein